MTITIRSAVQIVMDREKSESVALWWIEYGRASPTTQDLWTPFIHGLTQLCQAQGWVLEVEYEDVPSLAIFAGNALDGQAEMLTILDEMAIEMVPCESESLMLWRVQRCGNSRRKQRIWQKFVAQLARFCGQQGWILECGEDAYHTHSLAIFAQGFSSPDSQAIKAWEMEHLEALEE
ncbi:MAG: hypothetical protein R2867_02750 [Caldilineaceae bacterium]